MSIFGGNYFLGAKRWGFPAAEFLVAGRAGIFQAENIFLTGRDGNIPRESFS